MEWLGELLGGVAAGGLGGLTGLFGNLFNGWMEARRQEREHAHEEKMAKIDQVGMELEANLAIKREEIVALGEVDKAVAASRVEAVKAADVGDGIYGLVDRLLQGGRWGRFFGGLAAFQMTQAFMVVKLIRPAAFVFFAWIFWGALKHSMQGTVPPLDAAESFTFLVESAVYLVSMAASFYYCERNRIKAPERMAAAAKPSSGPGAGPALDELEVLELDEPPEAEKKGGGADR